MTELLEKKLAGISMSNKNNAAVESGTVNE